MEQPTMANNVFDHQATNYQATNYQATNYQATNYQARPTGVTNQVGGPGPQPQPGFRQPSRDPRQAILIALGVLVATLAAVAVGATLMGRSNSRETAATDTSIEPAQTTVPSSTFPDPDQTTASIAPTTSPAGEDRAGSGSVSTAAPVVPSSVSSAIVAAGPAITSIAPAGGSTSIPQPRPLVLVAIDDPDLTTMDVLLANPELSQFADMVEATGLDSYVDNRSNMTVLAPSNDAFTIMDYAELTRLLNDTAAVEAFVRDLLINEPFSFDDLRSGREFVSRGGRRITVDDDGTIVGGAHLVVADIMTSTGILHVIDRVPTPDR